MHRTVILVGTNHEYQWCDPKHSAEQIDTFRSFLVQLCRTHGVCAIAEEMSLEALANNGRKESVPAEVARELCLAHQYSDPDLAEQSRLGIANEGVIELRKHREKLSQVETDQLIAAEYRKREGIWLSRIQSLDRWPLLFVCGSLHVTPFCAQLKASGCVVKIVRHSGSE